MSGRIIRETRRESLTRIGKIKIGEKYVNQAGKEIPRSLDYFVADGTYKNLFDSAFGEKPNSIEIVFISDQEEDSCYERLELRQGAKLFAYGDGCNFKIWDQNSNVYVNRELDTDGILELEKKIKSKFEEVLTLNFLIPRIKVFGFWSLTTKGKDSSIIQIVSVFDRMKQLAGTVKGIPFDLKVEKVKSQKPDSKNLFPVLQLIPNLSAQNVERIKEFIQAGTELPFLITESKMDSLQEIEYKTDRVTEYMNKVSNTQKIQELMELGISIKESSESGEITKEETDKIRALFEIKLKTFKEVRDAA